MSVAEISTKKIYSYEDLKRVDPSKIPSHLAIIMDGNRRWARKKNYPINVGHWRGANTLTDIVRSASELGIKVVTAYSFSTENWSRSEEEVQGLIHLLDVYLKQKQDMMIEEGVRLSTIGDLQKMPLSLQRTVQQVKQRTSSCSTIELVLAINYGSRNEICRAVKKIYTDIQNQKITPSDLDESLFSSYLDTKNYKDPDLLIRTSGELRLSNFLLWQMSYSEVYITDVLWPDFTDRDLLKAVEEYQRRKRRLGGP